MVPFIPLAKRLKFMAPLLAAPAALLLSQEQAKAVLTYNIYESAGNVVVQASGSLDLSNAFNMGLFFCEGTTGGILISGSAFVCTGIENLANIYSITGPTSFNGTSSLGPASSVSGILTGLNGGQYMVIDLSYANNTPIVSSATFANQALAGLGFTTTGLIGTWTLNGTNDTIQVVIGAPPSPSAAVPGPLPLVGAGAAFGWSRRLRKRIAAPLSTPPQV